MRISGRVQGVGFRYATRAAAVRLGLSGWVRNLPDGRVEALFCGDENTLKEMLDWCRIGPPLAEVTHVEHELRPQKQPYTQFKITG